MTVLLRPCLCTAPLPWLYRQWQRLPVFRSVDWSSIALLVRPSTRGRLHLSSGQAVLGECILVRRGTDPADAAMTLLHEMTHFVAWTKPDHGPLWRRTFAEACAEATGCYPLATSYKGLENTVRELMRRA